MRNVHKTSSFRSGGLAPGCGHHHLLASQGSGRRSRLRHDLLVQDDLEDVKTFVDVFRYEFPVLLDKKGEVARQYRVVGIPSSYFIDKDGQIKYQLVGVTTPANLDKMFRSLIEPE
ncbi:MAG: TlpA family protein disulfide reductase [Limnochordales bacterium]|nr:TlpA family protein disulfide reductase [Limnochordales bacterium]